MNVTKIEKEYKDFLISLKTRNMTAESIQNDFFIYSETAEKTLEYLRKVALRSVRNRNLISTTGYEFDMFADDITMHMLRKLDNVFACDNDFIIKYIIKMVNNQVISICRKWESTYPTFKKTSKTTVEINDTVDENREPEFNSVVNFLDDIAWGLIADDTDIEEDIIRQENMIENHKEVIKVLANTNACSRFEMVSLLATKVITNSDDRCMKTRALAEAIDAIGLDTVSEACFEKAASVFDISSDTYFSSFTNDYAPAYSSIEELCDKISKASNSCTVKLCKKMGATRVSKKPTQK